MLSAINNISALSGIGVFNNLNRQAARLSKQMQTGKRITSSSVDAAGMAISNKMSARVSSLGMAQRNVGDARSVIGIADGALQGIGGNLKEIRKLTIQAKSDTLGADERTNIATQIAALVSDIDDYSNEAEYNGIALLDGSADLSIQSGADKGDTMSITIATAFDSTGLSVDSLDVSDSANSSTTLDSIDAAIKLVNTQQSKLGSLDNRFESRITFLDTSIENQTAALSQIQDLDYAKASSESMRLQVQTQATTYALQKSLQQPQLILSLLG